MNRTKSIAFLAAVALALSACGPTPQLPVPSLDNVTQQAPVAQGSDGYGAGTVAAAAIGGALVGNMLGKRSQPQHTIIQHAPAPGYYGGGSYGGYGRRTVTTTTTHRSLLGGRTVTRTVTRRR